MENNVWMYEAFLETAQRYFDTEDENKIKAAFVFFFTATSTGSIPTLDDMKGAKEQLGVL